MYCLCTVVELLSKRQFNNIKEFIFFLVQPPAPDDVLKVIRCNCKMTSRNTCGTTSCSCRSNGLKCVSACGDCKGLDCLNSTTDVLYDEDEYDDGNAFERLFGSF